MRKFYIKDEDGSELEITEVDEEMPIIEKKDEDISNAEVVKDELVLSEEEIAAIKKLAPVADKLLKLLEQEVVDEDTDLSDEDEEVVNDEEKEEVIDTSEEKEELKKDSKSSFGSTLRKKSTNDSLDDLEDKIAKAWSKRALNNK